MNPYQKGDNKHIALKDVHPRRNTSVQLTTCTQIGNFLHWKMISKTDNKRPKQSFHDAISTYANQ